VWPDDVPVPQAWLEFDVGDIGLASEELVRRGYGSWSRPASSRGARP
jgi:hypothetical protein